MVTKSIKPQAQEVMDEILVTSLQEVAETIQIDALQQASANYIQPVRATGIEALLQRHDFVEYFKFGLAERIANTLAAHDSCVQAVYYFDPHLNPDAETEAYPLMDPTVNVLVQVEARSAALRSFIDALDKALTEQVRNLPTSLFESLDTILNGIVFTEEDVELKRGYAALLSSFYLKPRRIL